MEKINGNNNNSKRDKISRSKPNKEFSKQMRKQGYIFLNNLKSLSKRKDRPCLLITKVQRRRQFSLSNFVKFTHEEFQ